MGGSDPKRARVSRPIVWSIGAKGSRKIVELVSQAAQSRGIPALRETHEFSHENLNKRKGCPLRWGKAPDFGVRGADLHNTFRSLIYFCGVDGDVESVAVLHSSECPVERLETWYRPRQAIRVGVTAHLETEVQHPQASELETFCYVRHRGGGCLAIAAHP